MVTRPRPAPQTPGPWWLRRADQAAVAALAVGALVALGIYWTVQGAWQGRLIEVDRQEPRTARFEVDVNQADWPELAQLPGVGETLAKRIVDARQTGGRFLDHNDLRRVRGIGPRTLERMKPYLRPLADAETMAGP